jgi:hypothetical protein
VVAPLGRLNSVVYGLGSPVITWIAIITIILAAYTFFQEYRDGEKLNVHYLITMALCIDVVFAY